MLNPDTIQFSIRVSRDTYRRLKEKAEKERRSLNAEIVKRIEEALAREARRITT